MVYNPFILRSGISQSVPFSIIELTAVFSTAPVAEGFSDAETFPVAKVLEGSAASVMDGSVRVACSRDGFVSSVCNEDMKRMEEDGRLDGWCSDNLKWLRETYGERNLVSAVLHMDEKTPHIHATIVPIVTGERRKARQDEQNGKKKYRKKNTQDVRLCADDVMARHKLKHYQDTYAQAMSKYGLQRGVDGSLAKHIPTSQYYKELVERQDSLQENIENLLEMS